MNKRALASLTLVFSVILLIPSGILLHANNEAAFQLRHALMTWHNAAAFLFVLAASAHVYLNRQAIWNYAQAKAAGLPKLKKELLLAAGLTFGSVALALLHVLHA